jgi:HK97 family phage prohead protease
MSTIIELRAAGVSPVRLEGRTLYGTAIPYKSDSHDLGGFVERFMPGSVTDTIKSGRIEAWTYHDRTKPLASQAGGSLRLFDRTHGLDYELDLPDTTYANDLRALMSGGRKDIGGTSFGFWPTPDGQRWQRENGNNVREIVKAELEHISPVVTPAYPATTAKLRALTGVEVDHADLYGIDLDVLTKIFVASKRGLILSDAEREVSRKAIERLRETVTTPRLDAAIDRASRMLL